jgi:predicted lipoprotein with Yx(FWY)xxD motif
VSTLKLADGTTQLVYKGTPLYLYSREKIEILPTGFTAAGNGNGQKAGGGTFGFVSP